MPSSVGAATLVLSAVNASYLLLFLLNRTKYCTIILRNVAAMTVMVMFLIFCVWQKAHSDVTVSK